MNQASKIFALSFLLSILSGCVSPEQRAAYREQARQYEQSRFEALRNKCLQYGFQSGTTAFAQCLQQAEQQEIMTNAIRLQQEEQYQQQQRDTFRRAQCYFAGRLDC